MNDNPFLINQTDTVGLNRFFAKVYGFVAIGIGLSALTSFLSLTVFLESTIRLMLSTGGSTFIWALLIAEVVLVLVASRMAVKNSPAALPLFIAYSILSGYTLSFVLLLYTQATVYNAFLSSALMFLVMSVIGMTTKRDLSAMAQALYAALWGVIIASIVNFFLASSTMSFVVSIISVLIFAGLTAYDNQRIRQVYEETNGEVGQGWVISLALELYLDFINLFLNLLRIFGSRD